MNRQQLILDDEVVDAIVGYRLWRTLPHNGQVLLQALHVGSGLWPPRETYVKRCYCDDFHSGFHTCGIYAQNTPLLPRGVMAIRPYMIESHTCGKEVSRRKALVDRSNLGLIAGEVLLWGTVERHEYGYRAQYARPSAFYVNERMLSDVRLTTELAALTYDVPLVTVG